MIEIFAVNIRTLEKIFDELVGFLSSHEQIGLIRFRFKEDRYRKLGSIYLTRLVFSYLKHPNKYFLKKNYYGKPKIENCPHLNFNISHSGEWVLLAIGQGEIGIDIERVKDLIRPLEIASRFFSENEYKRLVNIKDDNEKLCKFFEIWTKKESFIKYLGTGISTPLNSFVVPDKVYPYFTEESFISCRNSKVYFYVPETQSKFDNYKIAVSSEEIIKQNLNIKVLDTEEMYSVKKIPVNYEILE